MASYNAPGPRLWGNPPVGGTGELPMSSSLQPCQGKLYIHLGRRRLVCRLIPRRGTMRGPRDDQWSFVFEGFQAHLELPPSSQEFIFLYDASDAEASLFSSSLDSTRTMLTSAVLFYLHDPSLAKLHQGLVTTYPLLVSLPQMWVSEREVRAAMFSAVLYTNGLGATEALRESFYIESVAGISPVELGLDCRKIGSGLSNIQGRLRLDFGRRQHICRVYPIAGSMPLQANNWRFIYEGWSEFLDLPMAAKGFIYITTNTSDSLNLNEQVMLKNILIASTVSFVDRYVDRQASVVSVYPLVVTMDTFRLDGAALTRLLHACETARHMATEAQQPGCSPAGPGPRSQAPPPFSSQPRPSSLDSLLHSQQTRPLPLLSIYPIQLPSAAPSPPRISTFPSAAAGMNPLLLLRAACATQPPPPRAPSDDATRPSQSQGGSKKRSSSSSGPCPPSLNDARAAATLTDLLRQDPTSNGAKQPADPPERPPLKRRRGREGHTGPSLPLPLPTPTASAYHTANAALQSALLPGPPPTSVWVRDKPKAGGQGQRGPLSPPLAANGPPSTSPQSLGGAPHLLQIRKGELINPATRAPVGGKSEEPRLPTLLEALGTSTTSRWMADTGPRAGDPLASNGPALSVAEVLSGRFTAHNGNGKGNGNGSRKPSAVEVGRREGAEAKPPAAPHPTATQHAKDVGGARRSPALAAAGSEGGGGQHKPSIQDPLGLKERHLAGALGLAQGGAGSSASQMHGKDKTPRAAMQLVHASPAAALVALSTSSSSAAPAPASAPLIASTPTPLAPTPSGASKSTSPTKQLEELQEEVDYLNQMFHDLSVYNHGLKTELNEAKELLVKVGALEFPHILPVHTFCEASLSDVKRALTEGGRSTKAALKVLEVVDEKIRDASFDPLKRAHGEVMGVEWDHPVLVEIEKEHGRPVSKLIVQKKQEIERYCPSGHYPTPVLFEKGRELRLSEAIQRLIQALRDSRPRPRPALGFCPSASSSLLSRRGELPSPDGEPASGVLGGGAGGGRGRGGARAGDDLDGRLDDGPGSGPVMLQHEDGTTSVSVFHDELRRRLEEYVVQSRGLFSVSSARPVLTTMHKLVSKVAAQKRGLLPNANRSSKTTLLRTREDLKQCVSRNMEALIKEADRHGPHHRTAKAWRYILEYLGMKEVNEDVVSTCRNTAEEGGREEGRRRRTPRHVLLHEDSGNEEEEEEEEEDEEEEEGVGSESGSETGSCVRQEKRGARRGSAKRGTGERNGHRPMLHGSGSGGHPPREKVMVEELRRRFITWLEEVGGLAAQSAIVYCTCVDQTLSMVWREGGGAGTHRVCDEAQARALVQERQGEIHRNLEGRNRKFLAGWRHFLEFIGIMSRAQEGGASSHSSPPSTLSPGDAASAGAMADEGRASRRRPCTGALTRTESGSEGDEDDQDEEDEEEGEEEENEEQEEEEAAGGSKRRARRATTAGAAVAMSLSVEGEGEGEGDGEGEGEGEAVLGEPLRTELEKHVAALNEEAGEEAEGEGALEVQEVLELVSGAIEGLMGRRRGHNRPRCLHTAEEARHLLSSQRTREAMTLRQWEDERSMEALRAWRVFCALVDHKPSPHEPGATQPLMPLSRRLPGLPGAAGISRNLKTRFEAFLKTRRGVIGNTAKTYCSSVNKAVADILQSKAGDSASLLRNAKQLRSFLCEDKAYIDRHLEQAHKSLLAGWRHFVEFAEDTGRGDQAGTDDGDTEQAGADVKGSEEDGRAASEAVAASITPVRPSRGRQQHHHHHHHQAEDTLSDNVRGAFVEWLLRTRAVNVQTAGTYSLFVSRVLSSTGAAVMGPSAEAGRGRKRRRDEQHGVAGDGHSEGSDEEEDEEPHAIVLRTSAEVEDFQRQYSSVLLAVVKGAHKGVQVAWKHFQDFMRDECQRLGRGEAQPGSQDGQGEGAPADDGNVAGMGLRFKERLLRWLVEAAGVSEQEARATAQQVNAVIRTQLERPLREGRVPPFGRQGAGGRWCVDSGVEVRGVLEEAWAQLHSLLQHAHATTVQRWHTFLDFLYEDTDMEDPPAPAHPSQPDALPCLPPRQSSDEHLHAAPLPPHPLGERVSSSHKACAPGPVTGSSGSSSSSLECPSECGGVSPGVMLDAALFSPTATHTHTQAHKAASPPAPSARKDGVSAVSRDLQEAFVGWLTSILAMPTSAAYKYAFLTDTLVRAVMQLEGEPRPTHASLSGLDASPCHMLHDRFDALEFVRRRGERVEALLRHGSEGQGGEEQGWELVARSAWRSFVDFVSLAGR